MHAHILITTALFVMIALAEMIGCSLLYLASRITLLSVPKRGCSCGIAWVYAYARRLSTKESVRLVDS